MIVFNLKWLLLTAGVLFSVLNYIEHIFGVHKYWKIKCENAEIKELYAYGKKIKY